MYYCEFFSKYSDMFYYLTFLLGVTNISYNFFEYLSYSHKYDSSQLSKLEGIIHKLDGSIHTRLNDIDDKINMLHKIKLCEFKLLNLDANTVDSDSDSEKNESVIEDEVIHNNDEKCDFEIEEDTDSDTNDNEDIDEELETIEELEEPEENVCVDQNDINDYYKDKFIKDKQSNHLSLSGVFGGWY
jgi:hypothetical protein|uniref:Uncharacterized protein n=1 Tax=viral metagenome TaxID=1070528 RepID=A0A6C0ILK4_9ZZZZ